ncbi:hypothetical protein B0H10DRAFT_2092505, partial [Mycena sp. CBHHK59/15]
LIYFLVTPLTLLLLSMAVLTGLLLWSWNAPSLLNCQWIYLWDSTGSVRFLQRCCGSSVCRPFVWGLSHSAVVSFLDLIQGGCRSGSKSTCQSC